MWVDAPEEDVFFLYVLAGLGFEEDLGLDGGVVDAVDGWVGGWVGGWVRRRRFERATVS